MNRRRFDNAGMAAADTIKPASSNFRRYMTFSQECLSQLVPGRITPLGKMRSSNHPIYGRNADGIAVVSRRRFYAFTCT
jgi:hypothetical protein